MEYKHLPDMNALATLRAVVELGGVEQAARKLFVGQPAVTKRLRSLDASYGVALMQRKGRRLSLSPAGERVYAYARLVLDHQGALLEDLNYLREGQNRLRLEVSFAIGDHLLPELLLEFAERHPEYRIQSRMGYTRRIQTRLATGLADLALLEQAPDHPDILVQKWLEDELVLVCGPKHPLREREQLSLDELNGLRFVLREPQASMRRDLDRALAELGIQIPVSMEVGSTDTIIEMLERGKNLSFLPRFAVAEALQKGELFQLRVQGLHIARTLWIARTRANLNNPVAEAFIELLRSGLHS
ncbi:MAG: LysR family transcriptional regulator [Chromatiales bacterium]|nr:LysR family transcriptional regulator [Gammaproteobacteria bacterium]MBW6477128.1 LysR family transcriptional regulator [Chromatiales bacterium]